MNATGTNATWLGGSIRGAAGPRPVVVKFGGSLLARRDWPADLLAVVQRQGSPVTVVVGGGRIVDGLRELDAACPLPTAASHRLAIEALGITARVTAAATGLPLVATATAGILDVPAWLGVDDRMLRLPEGWHVTSDSIAAIVAGTHGARLVLAKSAPPPPGDLAALSAAGWVDGFFPEAAAGLPVIEWMAPASGSPGWCSK
ncbi:MAG: hypothetical protein ACKOC8_02410 [Pirellulales bacterium]